MNSSKSSPAWQKVRSAYLHLVQDEREFADSPSYYNAVKVQISRREWETAKVVTVYPNYDWPW